MIYSDFDGSILTGGENYYNKIMECLTNSVVPVDSIFNVFESAVLPKCPKATEIKRMILSSGALCAMMSGSGPSVFGMFENKEMTQKAKQNLISAGFNAFAVTSV